MKNQKFRQLTVWNRAMDFIGRVYRISEKFPKSEMYGLTSQMRRAATSIALNIAEGSAAASDLDFARFLTISIRSTYEVMCGTEIACRLGYCTANECGSILKECDELSAMLTGLKKSIRC